MVSDSGGSPQDQDPKKGGSHRLGGRVVAAGPEARRAIGRLLGIDRASGSYEIQSAAWMDHALEVAVSDDQKGLHVFRLERRSEESEGLVLTDHLVVYSRGKTLPFDLGEIVERTSREHLQASTTDDLACIVADDPESGRPGLPMPPSADDQKRPQSLLDTWGGDDSYADFFAGGEISRSQLDSIDPSRLFHFVQHCDAECLFVNPHCIGTVVSLVNYPWDDRVREPLRSAIREAENGGEVDDGAEGMVTTDLAEDDVILGNPEKLRSLLEYVTQRPNPDNKLLFVSNTCVPTVIGEDVESVVNRVREKSGRQMLYLTVTPRSMTNVFEGLLVDRRLEAEEKAPSADPHAINLVGFGAPRARGELEVLLGLAGIKVNTRLLPELSTERIDDLPRASMNVVYPNQLWQHLYDQLIDRSRIPHMMAPAPFGLEGTRVFIAKVAEAVGLEDGVEGAWDEHAAPSLERWEALQQRANRYRLGFVVRDEEAYYLTAPGKTWGVPLLAMIEEMGFGIDVLVGVSDRKVAKRAALSIRAAFRDPTRHSVLAFDSFAFMRQRLKESRSDAFLSYHFFDWRLSEAGKASFSIQHFEMGVPGAVRTFERLLRVCATPFYRRFGAYLSRTRNGLRKPSQPNRAGHG